ncbi:sulfatase family protein [Alienimonas californiensis]|uniref:Arylsulfatase n=1 Tax=Alienimonas californiensis TaxID=2527989 RepID=A0A517P601_9PLAN|nr:arylsulfatase [Alienimonas californiensis]QDT14808.1 Arylsulfatase [Alienimonas californiensis]
MLARFAFSFALFLPAGAVADDGEQKRPPNVVVIMADDLGYGDVSCYGATALETPHIDALADRGQRFTSGYCSASTCTPTRFSLLTGMYAFRQKGTGIAPPNAASLIQPETVTVADLLKQANYETAVVGKWHLGLGERGAGPDWNGDLKPGPLEIGFDHAFLLPTTNDRVPQVYVQDRRVLNLDPADPLWVGAKKPSPEHPTGITHRDELKMDWSHGHNGTIHNGISRIGFYTGGHAARFRDEDLADRWVAESVAFMETHQQESPDDPFFLFFSSHDLHVPRMPHERFQGATSLGFRGDSIVQLDWCVGELTAALERLSLTEETLVVFCSDNGPVLDDGYKDGAVEQIGDHQAAGPYRGGKYSVFEGGVRTPFITCWPGTIAPGVSEAVVCTIDLPASLAALAGVEIPAGACPDSVNVAPALRGEPGATGREELVVQNNGSAFALRQGRWKLHRHDGKRTQNLVVETKLAATPVPRLALFDLETDPRETNNLIEERPEIANQMAERLEAYLSGGRTQR